VIGNSTNPSFHKENFTMSAEQNKALIRHYSDLMNQHNLDAAFANLSPDVVANNAPPGPLEGIESIKQFFTMLYNAFPDFQAPLEDIIAEGDKVVIRFTFRGTHTNEFMGIPPTGKQVAYGIITIYRIADGKIAEVWSEADMMGMMQQLGLVPPPQPAR
jgi:steroid delta-isomerase-like uncharacterized protein